MTRRSILIQHLFRVVYLARTAEMKSALTEIDPDPHLNFWRLIHGNQLDIAVLEWCKVFGSDAEATHWKRVVPPADHNQFRDGLFAMTEVTADEWNTYWNKMKGYRDNLVAHHIELTKIESYPVLDLALKSSFFYYAYLIGELRGLGETRYPDNLQTYCEAFKNQARQIITAATASTVEIKEIVN